MMTAYRNIGVTSPGSEGIARALGRASGFVRGTRGSAGIELAIGVVMLVTVVIGAFAVYSRIEINTSTPQAAVVMAEYVSRNKETSGAEIDALARLLRDRELGTATDAVFRVSAIRRASGSAQSKVHWVEEIEVGDATATDELTEICGRYGDESSDATLGSHFSMDENQVVFAVEVCARYRGFGSLGGLLAGDIRYHHILPSRHPDETTPARPSRTPPPE